MYVRWKRFEGRKGYGSGLRAELIESYRDEVTRKPRTRYLGYLGSVRECDIDDWLTQVCFWNCLEVRLARLPLSVEEKEHARELVRQRVPSPEYWEKLIAAKFSRPAVSTIS